MRMQRRIAYRTDRQQLSDSPFGIMRKLFNLARCKYRVKDGWVYPLDRRTK